MARGSAAAALFLLAALAALLLLAPPAHAEGSKELTAQGGDRAYLEYRPGASIAGIPRKTEIKVYAKAGETINLGSSAHGYGSGTINYTRPDGTTGTCAAPTKKDNLAGRIENRTQEVAGPAPNANGYTPCVASVGANQGGIWKVEFTSPAPTDTTNPPAQTATAAWTQPTTVSYISAWDVTVRSSGGAAIPGRVYANYLSLNMGANGRSFSPNVYVQGRLGYRFRLDPNGLDPFVFIFFANNKGFRDGSGNPTYRSVQLSTGDVLPAGTTLHDPGSADTSSDVTHKLFLNAPASDLPASAAIAGGTTWLVNAPAAPPNITNFSFAGSDGTANQAAHGQGGSFKFASDAAGPYKIFLDINGDGTYGNANDRLLFGVAQSGQNTVTWDGKDGNGNAVAAGSGSIRASVTGYVGEIHFPILDAENNPGGTKIERLNPSSDYTVHYNDTGLTGSGTAPGPLDGHAGVSSLNGAQAYSGTWGDHKGIDTWAFGAGTTVALQSNIQIKSADLAVTKTDNQTNTASGRQTTYTVTVTNNGPSNITGANLGDTVPSGITGVGWTCRVTAGTGSCGASSGTGNNVSTALDLNANAVATITVTGTVAQNAPATLSNTATITRPNDVEDPNTNNNSATDTTSVNRQPTAENKSYATNEDQTLTVNAPGLLANASDPDTGQTLTPELVNGPKNGNANLNADGSFAYTPGADYNGTDTFTYRVCDNGTPRSCSEPASVTVAVNPVNDPPTAKDDGKATDEDNALTFPAADLTANDSPGPANESGQTLAVTSVGNAQNGTVSLAGGRITFTPNHDYNGPASFTYTVSDGQGGTATATVSVTVRPVNDPPDAVDDSRATDEDTPVNINVLVNDTDPENNTLTVGSVSEPQNGTATIKPDGTIAYAPRNNFAGTDTFTYAVSDGNGGLDTATVTVTVAAVNDPPANSVPGRQAIDEDNRLVFSQANNNRISVSDPDANGNPVRVALAVQSGTLTLGSTQGLSFTTGDGAGDPTMTFTGTIADANAALEGLRFDPAADFNGNVDLAITTNDRGNTGSGGALEDSDTVPITVNAINDAPTVSNITDRATKEDTATGRIAFTIGDVETAPGDLVVRASSSDRQLVPDGNMTLGGTGAERTIDIVPAADRSGTTTITLTVRDAGGATTTRTFVLTVDPVNDAPAIDLNGDGPGTGYSGSFEEGGGPAPAADPGALTTNDIDNDNLDSATVTLTNRPDGRAESLSADVSGTRIAANYDPQTGVLRLTGPAPVASFRQVLRTVTYDNTSQNPSTAEREISFVVNDGNANSNTATATLKVARTNDPPTARDDSYTTDEDRPLTVDAPGVLANDSDPDGDDVLAVASDRGPQHGSVTLDPNGSFRYTPNADFSGTDTFTYTVSDGSGASGTNTATVAITVNPVNDGPVAQNDRRAIPEDQTLNIPASELLQNDSPGPNEGDQTLRVTRVGDAVNGAVRLENGRVIFAPDPNYFGEASFSYTVCDDGNPQECDTAEVNVVDVTPINDAPRADDDAATTDEDNPVTIDVLDGDTPGPGNEGNQTLTVTGITNPPADGGVRINPDNTVTYTPDENFNGTDAFVYRVCDDGNPALCATAAVDVTVNGANDAPVAADDRYEIRGGDPLTVGAPGVLDNDSDLDGDNLTVKISRQPTQGTVGLNPDGSFTYAPGGDFDGEDTFAYEVSDGSGASGTDTATVTITNIVINDPPVAHDDAGPGLAMDEDDALTFPAADLTANDSPGPGEGGQNLTVTEVANAHDGTVSLDNGRVTFAPDPDYFGEASFTYTVCDDGQPRECDAATVTINVAPVNDVPTGKADRRTIPEDQALNIPAGELTQNDSAGPNEGSQTLTVTDVGGAVNGTVRLENGRVIFTPDADYNGPAQFDYTVCDDGQPRECAVSEVNIVQVAPVNDVPVADDDAASTDEDTPVEVDVLDGDAPGPADENGQTLTVAGITGPPANGTATINPDGTVTYDPNGGFNGTDAFGYRVCDDGDPSRCDTATVTVTVHAVNDAPVNSLPGEQTVDEDSTLVFSRANGNAVSISDPDAGDEPVRVTLAVQNGGLTLSGAGGLTFSEGDGTDDRAMTFTGTVADVNAALDGLRLVPNANFDGRAALTVTANDRGNTGSGGALEDSDTVAIDVRAVNDAPTISEVENRSTPEDTTTGPISFTVGDQETPAGDLVLSATSSDQQLVPDAGITLGGTGAERTVTVRPAANRTGTTAITLTVRDAEGQESAETFTLTVNPVNDEPVNSVPGPQQTDEDTPLVFSSANENPVTISDPDANGGTVRVTVSVPDGSGTPNVGDAAGVTVEGDGTAGVTLTGTIANINAALDGLSFAPANNTNGDATLTVTTNDMGHTGSGGPLSDEDAVAITVNADNDAPSFDLPANPGRTVDEDAGAQTVEDFATDISPGPNEGGQRVRFEATNDDDALFARGGQPAISPDGTLTYTPAPDANGAATVTVVAVDDGGTPDDPSDDVKSAPRTFTITVAAVNDAPTISAVDDRTTDEDTATGPISFTVGDRETPAGDLRVTATSSKTDLVPNGNITASGTGAERTVSIAPAPDQSGTATITLTVRDANGRESAETFVLTVSPVNDDPEATDDEKTITEDGTLTFSATDLTQNDSPGPNEGDQALTVTNVGNAHNGTVSLKNGRIAFAPDPDYNGPASFTYAVSDGHGGTGTATVRVAVTAENDPPVIDLNGDGPGTGYAGSFEEGGGPAPAAGPDALAVDDADDADLRSATVKLDNRPDGDAESLDADTAGTGITASYDPSTGVLTLAGNAPRAQYRQVLRSVTYDNTSRNPSPGEREIDFVVRDADSASNTATAIVTVSAANDPPAVALPGGPVNHSENDPATPIDPGATVTDPDSANFGGGRLTVDFAQGGTAPDQLAIRDQGTNAGQVGVHGDTVTYGGTTIGTFSGGDNGTTPLVVIFNENATPEAVRALASNITFRVGSDDPSTNPRTVRFVVTDGDGGQSDPATKTVNVSASDDAPEIDLNGGAAGIDYSGGFTEDGGPVPAVDRNVLAVTDADDDNIESATVTLTNHPDGAAAESLAINVPAGSGLQANYDPQTGVLALTGSAPKSEYRDALRTVTYDNTSQNPDTTDRRIEFVVGDGDLDSRVAVSAIRITRAPDAPDAANDASRADEGGDPVLIDVLANDADPEGDPLAIAGVQGPPAGEGTAEVFTDDGRQKIRYTPNPDFNGQTTFAYTISDGNGGTDTATVTVVVRPTNDDPVARGDEANVPEDSGFVRIDALANDSDNPDTGETLTIQSVGQPSDGGTAEIVEGGAAIRYRPAPNFTGTETFAYTLSDGNGGTDTATVAITVGGDNDPPAIGGFGGTVTYTEGDPPLVIDPDLSVSDPDSPDFDGGELIVAVTNNGQSAGRIEVRDRGTGPGEIGTDGDDVTYGGRVIGTFTPGTGSTPLVVNLNENATPEAVQALARNITYRNVSENPTGLPRTVTLRLTDGDGGTQTAQKTIDVVAVPDAPVVELTQAPATADEGQTKTYAFAVTDPDSNTFAVADGFPSCGDGGRLVEGSLSTTPTGGNFRCRFPDGPANPTVAVRVVDPQGARSNTAGREVEVANLAPRADADGPYEADEDTTLRVGAANGVLAGDTDAGGDPLTAVLVQGPPAEAGELTLNEDGSFAFTPAENHNGQASFTYTACETGSDPRVCSDPVRVNIDVASVNDAPVANDDAATIREDETRTIDVISNDTDPDGHQDLNPASVRVVGAPHNGRATANNDGSITYTPNADYNGQDGLAYEVCDNQSECSGATVRITVNPVNDAPLARDDEATTPEDTGLRIPQENLLDNDDPGPADEGGQTLRITGVGNAQNGAVRLADNGDVIFTPDPGYNGPASFTYTVTDGQGNTDTATATVNVTVSPVNDDPLGQPDQETTPEDQAVAIDVLANDADPENDGLSIAEGSLTRPQNGTVEIVDGRVRYTPNADFNGTDTFDYRAADGNGGTSAPVTVTVTVSPVNDAPNGNPNFYAVGEDARLVANGEGDNPPGVLVNDDDPDHGDTLRVRLGRDVQHGTLDLNEDGTFTYTPGPNYDGPDSFTYVAVDGAGAESDPVTVRLTVGGDNDAPVAQDDAATTQEDKPVTIDVLANDNDPDNDALNIRRAGRPQNGSAEVRNGHIFYTPNPDFNGTDTFEYTVVDVDGATDTATVTVTVDPVNDAPIARDDAASTPEDTQLRIPQADLLSNDAPGPPNENGTLRITGVGNAQNGSVRLADDGSGDVIFTPAPGYNGPASFVYTVTDGQGNTDTATADVAVTVSPVNDPPEAVNDRAGTGEDEPVTVDVLANDYDPEGELDASSVRVVTQPRYGRATVNSDGGITYDPNANFNGTDTFTYEVCDEQGACDAATAEVSVGAANDAPTANDDAGVTDEDNPIRVNVLANDDDPEGREELDPSSVGVTINPAHGVAVVNADGSITYRPGADYNGDDTFAYRVCDTGTPQQCDTARVNVTVSPVNDPPRAQGSTIQATEAGEPIIADVLFNDTDPDGDTLAVLGVTQPPAGQGTVEIIRDGQNAGKVRFTPGPDFNGETGFAYTVSDGNGGTDRTTVRVNVHPSNDAPTAVSDAAQATEGGQPVRIDVLSNDRVAPDEGEILMITDFTQPPAGQGTVSCTQTACTYTPDPDYTGETTFTYTVNDGNGGTDAATVTVNVAGDNDPPLARPDGRTVAEDATLRFPAGSLTTNDSPGDPGQTLTVTGVSGAQNGAVSLQDGQIVFAPAPNYNGPASFAYTVCDDGDPRRCDAATVDVDVTPVNDAPVVRDDRDSTGEAAAVSNAYVSQYASSKASTPTRLYRFNTARDPYTLVKTGADIARPMNAIGYRSTDRSLYGYRMTSSPGVVKVNPSTGAARYLGNPRGLPLSSGYIAGDVSPNGSTYYLYANKSGVLQEVNLATFRASSVKLSSKIDVPDLAVSPTDGDLYGVAKDGRLLRVDPRTGRVTATSVAGLKPGTYGATWFTAKGDLIAYENGTSSTSGALTWIARPTTAPSVVSTQAGPSTVGNDGAAYVAPPNPAGLSVVVDVLANDGDPDGALDRNTLRIVRPPASGTARVNADKTITYTSGSSYRGTDQFRYEVCDNDEPRRCGTATANITSAPVTSSTSPTSSR